MVHPLKNYRQEKSDILTISTFTQLHTEPLSTTKESVIDHPKFSMSHISLAKKERRCSSLLDRNEKSSWNFLFLYIG